MAEFECRLKKYRQMKDLIQEQQAEKAISGRADAGDGVIPVEGLTDFYSAFHSNR